jgi:hypothetical protein
MNKKDKKRILALTGKWKVSPSIYRFLSLDLAVWAGDLDKIPKGWKKLSKKESEKLLGKAIFKRLKRGNNG